MNNSGISTAPMPSSNRFGGVIQSGSVRSVAPYVAQNASLATHSAERSLTRTAPLTSGGQVARYAVIPRTISTVNFF